MILNKTARRVNKKPAKLNVRGKSGDPNRGTWCTPEHIAQAVGPFDLDPFGNPRSHIDAERVCMLEDGGDGFGGEREDSGPGSYKCGGKYPLWSSATEHTRVWIQPPYDIVMRALKHYEHSRFVSLLRFDPRTSWFRWLYPRVEMVCVLRRCNFEPPPGVKASSSTFPHALYYRCADDVTDDVLRLSISWRKKVDG